MLTIQYICITGQEKQGKHKVPTLTDTAIRTAIMFRTYVPNHPPLTYCIHIIHYSTLLLGKRLGWGVPLPRLNVAIRFVKIKLECMKIPMIIYHQVHETIKNSNVYCSCFFVSDFIFFLTKKQLTKSQRNYLVQKNPIDIHHNFRLKIQNLLYSYIPDSSTSSVGKCMYVKYK